MTAVSPTLAVVGVLRWRGGSEAWRDPGPPAPPGNRWRLAGWEPVRPEKLAGWWPGLTPAWWDWRGPLKKAGWSPLAVVTMQQLGGMLGGGRDSSSG